MIGAIAKVSIVGLGLFWSLGSMAEEHQSGLSPVNLTALTGVHSQGVNFELGRGVPQDDSRAAEWYLKGAEAGYAESQNDLARLYDLGRGVSQDNVRAYLWYSQAALQGNSCALHEREDLRERMSEFQLTEAERLLKDQRWSSKGRLLSKIE